MPNRLILSSSAIAACASLLAACVQTHPPECRRGEHSLTQDSLHFGTASPAGPVSDEQWQAFVTQVVAVEFPKGFTILQGQGAWRGGSGDLQYEESHVLQIVHENDAASDAAIERVITRYKQQFQQESVLRVSAATCAAF